MSDTNFVPGTTIASSWLNDVNNNVYYSNTKPYIFGQIGKVIKDRVWSITDAPWNAVGDGTTDNYSKIVAAQTALSAAGGGTLLIPRGTFRITQAIPRVSNVDFVGTGWSSVLAPDGCGAFVWTYIAGATASSRTSNMYIEATNGGSQVALLRPDRSNTSDEINNITISQVGIRGFNKCIQFQTVRQVNLDNNWFFDTNHAIHLRGICFNVFMTKNIWVKAAGSGTGTSYGVKGEAFTYTIGGIAGPEGIRMDSNLNYGFEYAEDWSLGVEIRSTNIDLQATRIGIRVSGTTDYSLSGGYFDMVGPNVEFGIHCPAQGVSNNTKYKFERLDIHTVGGGIPANASGIMLGTRAVTGNVDNVTIEGCTFSGWTGYDIEQFGCGYNRIEDNYCKSTGTTASMSITSCPAGRPTYVDKNHCDKTIVYDQADFDSQVLQLRTNTINGTTINYGREAWFSRAFNAANYTANGAMTWTLDPADAATDMYKYSGTTMTMAFSINTSSVGGTLNNQLRIALPLGKTITRTTSTALATILDNGVRTSGYMFATAGNNYITLNRADAANWSASTNNTYVFGTITMEVA